MVTFAETTEEMCRKLADTLIKKNHDYGDSFHRQISKHGEIASLLRLEEKIDRLDNLIKNESSLVDESMDDTLLDIAGYAILTLVTRQRLKSNGF